MNSVRITGGKILKGEVIPQGAKNEALQILSAVLLTEDKLTINNVPDIIDVNKLIEILENLGVSCSNLKKGTYEFSAKSINLDYLKSDEFISYAKSLRGSIMLVGPLLARYNKASIPRPGGDKIGRRRLDTHFVNLEKLGAKLDYDSKNRIYNVKTSGLVGADLLLDEASVTGTANVIMASVLAKGKTRIYNAACEPYIQQLCSLLIKMGANIEGIGSNLLTISGVKKLNGANHTILPDMIEIGSWIGLAAMTKSEIRIKNVSWENLGQIPNTFRKLGIKILKEGDDMIIPSHKDGYEISNYIDGSILTISDAPWPGFSPDLISIILVVATQARGSILVHQKMFESRLFFVDKLIDMGAKIILSDPHRASVIGLDFKSELKATVMSSPDIRAGIALLIAALSADGTSVIQNVEQIDRGYENIVKRLNQLGAEIERI
ncbi:MAG: UDP-N-acetylglucosamine 1-carboxyvinyltransferase [Candidatus Marisimplicoccus sp.]